MKKYFTVPRLVCLLAALAFSATANASPSNKLPDDAFKVERDDGEDVLVKKRMGAASFDVDIISITVKDVRINPERE